MQVLGVQVGSNYNLKSVAPHTLGELCSDLLCQFGSDIRFVLKAQIPVIGLDTVAFVELLFDRYELVTLQKRESDLVMDGCEPPCGCWDLNS